MKIIINICQVKSSKFVIAFFLYLFIFNKCFSAIIIDSLSVNILDYTFKEVSGHSVLLIIDKPTFLNKYINSTGKYLEGNNLFYYNEDLNKKYTLLEGERCFKKFENLYIIRVKKRFLVFRFIYLIRYINKLRNLDIVRGYSLVNFNGYYAKVKVMKFSINILVDCENIILDESFINKALIKGPPSYL